MADIHRNPRSVKPHLSAGTARVNSSKIFASDDDVRDQYVRNSHSRGTILVHLIETDSVLRAKISHSLMASGVHTEIYAGLDEFTAFAPKDGVIMIDESIHRSGSTSVSSVLDRITDGFPVIVFSKTPTVAGVVAAMKSHASNYLSLDVSDSEIVAAVKEAFIEAEGKRERQTERRNCGTLIDRLTARELEVLKMLVEGESNKGMARRLDLSPRTIEVHRTKLMGKLGAKSSAQAVRIWCDAGFGV